MEETYDDSIDKRRLKAISRPSDGEGLEQLARHAGALLCTGILVLLAPGILLLPAMGQKSVLLQSRRYPCT